MRAAAVLLVMAFAFAQAPAVSVQGGWVRVLPAAKDTAAYMTLINNSDKPLRLVGADSEVAMMGMPMVGTSETKVVNGVRQEVKGMRTVPYLEIPAKGRRVLQPGGDHLMLMGLKRTLKVGERITLVLRFEGGLRQSVVLPAEAK